jgi:hypothetical protein
VALINQPLAALAELQFFVGAWTINHRSVDPSSGLCKALVGYVKHSKECALTSKHPLRDATSGTIFHALGIKNYYRQ